MSHTLTCADSFEIIDREFISSRNISVVFADPPDNIGLKYDDDPTGDRMEPTLYYKMLTRLIQTCVPLTNVFYLSFNTVHTAALGHALHPLGFTIKPIIQTFTFGNYQPKKLTNCHRPIWMITKTKPGYNNTRSRDEVKIELFPERIQVRSRRQELGDRRAAGPRTPGDVWDFPRVVGNAKQRRSWHKTQLNEDLVKRAVAFAAPPGTGVLDPFTGTATTLRAVKALNSELDLNLVFHGIERSKTYCDEIMAEHPETEFAAVTVA